MGVEVGSIQFLYQALVNCLAFPFHAETVLFCQAFPKKFCDHSRSDLTVLLVPIGDVRGFGVLFTVRIPLCEAQASRMLVQRLVNHSLSFRSCQLIDFRRRTIRATFSALPKLKGILHPVGFTEENSEFFIAD